MVGPTLEDRRVVEFFFPILYPKNGRSIGDVLSNNMWKNRSLAKNLLLTPPTFSTSTSTTCGRGQLNNCGGRGHLQTGAGDWSHGSCNGGIDKRPHHLRTSHGWIHSWIKEDGCFWAPKRGRSKQGTTVEGHRFALFWVFGNPFQANLKAADQPTECVFQVGAHHLWCEHGTWQLQELAKKTN